MTTPPPSEASEGPYQSLYRRFRPQRFSEVLGQEFVSLALQNAVREERVGHAYLFSGPRGTGKTSTARILAKALNCENPVDGEPCGVCASCKEITAGSSLDVHELDAASNNGVDAMRDLVSRAALGTPGRWKVYIVDEVHMLSPAASGALLKTLEEPPAHVIFVLATTDPQKVISTIRSRTQHFEFRLIGPETLHSLLESVSREAGLELPEHAVEAAVRRGKGSARDALSVLDQVAAAGIVEPDAIYLDQLAEALAVRDSQAALVAFARALAAGKDPLLVAGELAEHLRQGFLSLIAPELVGVDGQDRSFATDLASKMGLAAIVRAIEALGSVQVDMRESPDPRLHVEVCLLRLTRAEADESMAAVLERIERLERAVAGGSFSPARMPTPTSSPVDVTAESPEPATAEEAPRTEAPVVASAETAKRSLGAIRREAAERRTSAGGAGPIPPATTAEPQKAEPPAAAPEQAPTPLSGNNPFPTRDELVQAWGDGFLASLAQRPRARFRVGRFTDVDPTRGVVTFALPNEAHKHYCEEVNLEVEVALSERFGVPIKLRLIVDPEEAEGASSQRQAPSRASAPAPYNAPMPEQDEEESDLLDPEVFAAETEPAGDALSAAERLKLTFPGAQEV
jgi:DNA polymerase-3 subunit gamma/tau